MYDEQRTLEKKDAKAFAKYSADRLLRERLLASTMACAAERGFHALTTDHVAAHAGVSAGTLFRIFASKTELLRAAMRRAESLLRHAGPERLSGETLYEQLQNLWDQAAENAFAHPASFQYWRLYRTTPLDAEWGFPMKMREGPLHCVALMLDQATSNARWSELDASLASAQWAAAVQFVLAPSHPSPCKLPVPRPVPTKAQVLSHSFQAFWKGLALSPHLKAVDFAYM